MEGKISKGKLFRYDGIKIEEKNKLPVSILFRDYDVPYNKIKIKLNGKYIELNVAKIEWLIVDKIFTYLRRREQKDIEDIKEIKNIIEKTGYNKELLIDIFNIYTEKYKKYEDKALELLEEYLGIEI
ncbi:MAG: hypothetical protein ACP5GJ_01075 [Nanopusillaceae archaeon]